MSTQFLPVILVFFLFTPPGLPPSNRDGEPDANRQRIEGDMKDLQQEIMEELRKPIGKRDDEKIRDLFDRQKVVLEQQRRAL